MAILTHRVSYDHFTNLRVIQLGKRRKRFTILTRFSELTPSDYPGRLSSEPWMDDRDVTVRQPPCRSISDHDRQADLKKDDKLVKVIKIIGQ